MKRTNKELEKQLKVRRDDLNVLTSNRDGIQEDIEKLREEINKFEFKLLRKKYVGKYFGEQPVEVSDYFGYIYDVDEQGHLECVLHSCGDNHIEKYSIYHNSFEGSFKFMKEDEFFDHTGFNKQGLKNLVKVFKKMN